MVKLLYLCRITYNLQNQDIPNRFSFMSIYLFVAVFQNDSRVYKRPESRMTLMTAKQFTINHHKF